LSISARQHSDIEHCPPRCLHAIPLRLDGVRRNDGTECSEPVHGLWRNRWTTTAKRLQAGGSRDPDVVQFAPPHQCQIASSIGLAREIR
jgi:hypothetical protein